MSATPSGGWLQSSPAIPGLGFALGTRAQMFWLKPGLPSSLAPGKRPRTTLSVSLLYRDGKAYGSFGTPGGDQQDQWSSVFFLRHAHHRMNLQSSIDAPMFHNDHMPSSFFPRQARPGSLTLESRFSEVVQGNLARRGHQPGHQPRHARGRLHKRRLDSWIGALARWGMDRRAGRFPLGGRRRRCRHGHPFRSLGCVRIRYDHRGRQSGGPNRFCQ